MGIEDEQLLKSISKGDKIAFKELFNRYAPQLIRFVRRMIRNRGEPEELVQDIMVRIWSRSDMFDITRGKARPWIYSIATRVTLNWLESKAAQWKTRVVSDNGNLETTLCSHEPNPEVKAIQNSETIRIKAGLDCLSDDMRLVLIMRFQENLGVEEIAQILQCPPGTIKSRIFYGLKKLRTVFKEQ